MKAELRFVQHTSAFDAAAVEVWHNGTLIAAIYGADGPGVRIISKHIKTEDSVNVRIAPDPQAGVLQVILKP